MTDKQAQIMQTQSALIGWFSQWAAYCVAGAAYIFGLFLIQHTLVSFLLLTGIYGAWIATLYIARKDWHPGWWLVLFCLACFSLFTPLPSANVYWLPILPTETACLLVVLKPRYLGLLLAGTLWVGTGLTLSLVNKQLDIGAQIILLISFSSICGCTLMIQELALAHTRLQEYSAQVEELSVVRERNRIAREIHDTLGHALTLLAVQLETATQFEARGDPRLREKLLEARRVAKACLTDVRHSVEALRPDEALHGSLQEQLRKLVAEFESNCHGTNITLDLEEATQPLNPELSLALYRCAQEALTNIRKHAHATKVLLRLSTSAEQKGEVELTILDNGQGGAPLPEQSTSGFGLLGIRERVALLNGTLQAGPDSRGGWRVEVVLPLNKNQGRARISAPRTHDTREKV